jgi:hypothetical protein
MQQEKQQTFPPRNTIQFMLDDIEERNGDLVTRIRNTKGWTDHIHKWMNEGKNSSWVKKTYKDLDVFQKHCFYIYVMAFMNSLNIGEDDWSLNYRMYSNDLTVSKALTLLLKICDQIANQPFNAKECWRTIPSVKDQGYLYVGTSWSIRGEDGKMKKKSFRCKAARLISGMFHEDCIVHGEKGLEASHRCHNHPDCVNPWHIVPETTEENQDRKNCKNGCANYCPHREKCIWTTYMGRYKKHRNDSNHAYSRDECDCNVNCFG